MTEMISTLKDAFIENPKEMILAVLTFVVAFALYYVTTAIFN